MIVFNPDRCVGCYACQVACKVERGLPAGACGITVLSYESLDGGGERRVHYRALLCHHCADAPCVRICPVRAVTRDKNGIVSVASEKCIGCRLCSMACPHSIPSFNDRQQMTKCNLCIERIEAGLKPACVAGCPVAALELEDPREISVRKRRGLLRKRCCL